MKKWILAVAAFNLLVALPAQASAPQNQTKTIITIEQQASPGKITVDEDNGSKSELNRDDEDVACPCPYSMDKNGQLCGNKSAFTKNKGTSPNCYANGNSSNPNAPVNEIYIK